MHRVEINQLYSQQAEICQKAGIFSYSGMKLTGFWIPDIT